jgi:hypothetical protein
VFELVLSFDDMWSGVMSHGFFVKRLLSDFKHGVVVVLVSGFFGA